MNILVLLNGERPSKKLLLNKWETNDLKICADGAANYLYELGMTPNLIIGDFDSISSETLKYFSKVKKIKIDDQNTTDGEKVISYCFSQKKAKNVNVLGAFGKRLDHGLYNLSLMKTFLRKGPALWFFNETEKIFIITESTVIHEPIGTRISLIPIFGRVNIVSTRGLEWDLGKSSLEFGYFSSISNRMKESHVEIMIESGQLLVIIDQSL